jgi:hypothetical protein
VFRFVSAILGIKLLLDQTYFRLAKDAAKTGRVHAMFDRQVNTVSTATAAPVAISVERRRPPDVASTPRIWPSVARVACRDGWPTGGIR